MSESATSPRRLSAAERRVRAVELRRSGATFEEIARQLGYSGKGKAFEAVAKAVREAPYEAVAELRVLEGARLDALQMGIWAKARQGNVGAIDRVLAIMARRARLFGLDAPQAINLKVTAEMDAQIEELLASLEGGEPAPAEHPG